jgi:glutathione S-transferase
MPAAIFVAGRRSFKRARRPFPSAGRVRYAARMPAPVRIIGSYLSPYVRKVLVCLHLKGLAYEIDPIAPFLGDDRFSALSPLRRIPVFQDGDVTLCDSTVICEYLEDRHPDPPLYPRDVGARARARWLEEYADTRMGEVFIWRLFNEVAIRPAVWGEPTDRARLEATLATDVPAVLDYLERELPADAFLFGGAPTVADVTIGCFFRNAAFARVSVDAGRWPVTAAFVARVVALEPFRALAPYEERCMRVPAAAQRDALAQLGAPVTAETYGTAAPRRGVMQS